ncbi:hypothetical protein CEK28_14025 [Xenophilus sp. AP218F]|nr:hypothetical protein CEK28_14025 [Xenophilus sp. AP218F]
MLSLNAFAGLAAGPVADASFRGVRFDCLKSVDSAERDQAQYEYPYLDGADIEDLGRKARKVALSAMFWGADYPQRLRAFIAALDAPGPGELIHPVFGSMARAQVCGYQIQHDADAPDSCTVEVSWVEATPGNPFFANRSPLSQCESVLAGSARLRQQAGAIFARAQELAAASQGALARLGALRQQLTATVTQLSGMARQTVAIANDLLAAPHAFVAEVNRLVDDIADWRFDARLSVGIAVGGAPKTAQPSPRPTLADWNALRRRLDKLPDRVRQSIAPGGPTLALAVWSSDQQRIDALLQLSAASRLTRAAASLFAAESEQASLTPPALEQVAGDARAALQTALDAAREGLAEDAYPLTQTLRELGLQVQESAAALIARRPPLLTRPAPAACSLRQLAQLWYGDSDRAAELLRLNPQLIHPNHLSAGTPIHGYAR